MRRILASMGLAVILSGAFAGVASAHVHGITPLRCVGVDWDGANRTNDTPAAAANGGPILGLIPKDVGASDLQPGDGGFDTPACPA